MSNDNDNGNDNNTIIIDPSELEKFRQKHDVKPFKYSKDYKYSNNLSYLYHVDTVCIDDIQPKNQPWLWENVIPLDAFTLFAGVGGLGKSQLLMFLAAHVSNGCSFEAGGKMHQMPQGAVLILSSEDSLQYALSPRLRALKADTSQIHLIKSVTSQKDPFKKRLMALDQDLSLLKSEIERLKKDKGQIVKLIIIDPIVNFIGKTKDFINTEVSNFLYGLTDLAEQLHLSIILNKHLRKKDSAGVGSAIDEIAGSLSWVNTARQVWIICRDNDDKDKILFLDGKSNIKAKMSGLAFKISSNSIFNHEQEEVKTSKIVWLNELVTISADEAVNEEKYNKSKLDQAIDYIIDHLRIKGQSVLKIIKDSAISAGIKSTTLDEAVSILKKDDRIKITRGIYPNLCWELKY